MFGHTRAVRARRRHRLAAVPSRQFRLVRDPSRVNRATAVEAQTMLARRRWL